MRFSVLILLSFLAVPWVGFGQVTDDNVSTPEDTPLTFNVTDNDSNVLGISPSTVDLDASTSGIQNTFNTEDGNYSVNSSGDVTFMPALDFFGTTSITYSVNNGLGIISAGSATINVEVTSVNDAPFIDDQTGPISIAEEQSRNIGLSDLVVIDTDDAYPADFTLTVLAGSGYTFSGNTITPNDEFNGPLIVNVEVNDGELGSNTFGLVITVTPVNDLPSITGQVNSIGINEGDSYTVQLADLTVTDADDSYPGSFTLTVLAGTNYTFSGNTITPADDYNGPLSVNVKVNDGDVDSNIFGLAITVGATNDVPVINSQTGTITINEEQSRAVAFTDLNVTDPDDTYPTDFTLKVLAGTNYTFSGTTVTPAANHTGSITVNVQVNDGTDDSNVFGLVMAVTAVNDAPVINGQTGAITINEGQARAIQLADLSVTDPDDTYPTDFTLKVLSGTNYTVSGNTITPATEYSGPLSVNVQVNDGTVDSNIFGLAISVSAVNDAPIINGQTGAITINEEQSRAIQFTDLNVSDIDNTYPTGFTLKVLAGTNYTFSGTTITPATNHTGSLSVNVQVNDGTDDSNVFGLVMTVTAVNDAPVINGQTGAITINEGQSRAIQLSDLTVTDPDDTYPTDFTLKVLSGTNYTVAGNMITPAANYNGPLNVNVQVNDGTVDSNIFGLAITVSAVNDAPVITGQTGAITINEDQTRAILLTDLAVTDPDDTYPADFTLKVTSGTNYTVSGNSITPASNYSGPITVNVQVNDGTTDSNVFGLAIAVSAVNDAPQITGQPSAISIAEGQSRTIQLTDLTVADPDDTYPADFTLKVLSGTNYTVAGNTITPVGNYNGALTVNVQVNDGSVDSNVFGLQISVGAVNDAPVITGQTGAIMIAEEATRAIQFTDLSVTDPDDTYPTDFTLKVLSGTNYTVSGTSITPALNYNGPITVNVQVNDGSEDSNTFGLAMTVSAVNDVPVINSQTGSLAINEGQSLTVQLSHLSVTDPDDTYPGDFTLKVQAGTNYTFSGNTITPTGNFSGVLTVNVKVNDGTVDSNVFGLIVSVGAVNDPPVITGQPASITIAEEQSRTIQFTDLTVSDPDDTYPADFTLKVLAGTNYTFSGNTITPITNYSGPLSVNVQVNDGSVDSNIFGLAMTVTAVNDVPSITGQTGVITLSEGQSRTIQFADLTVTDPDDAYPAAFTLKVLAGTNYTFTGNTITPAPSYNGSLSVNVQVNDGDANSNIFGLQISVSSVNDAPVITGQKTVSLDEDQSVTILLTDLTVTDPDNTYPNDFTLTVLAGTNYTFSGNVITPASNFNGTLTVNVKVNDGTKDSNTFGLQVTVNAINDAPAFTQIPHQQVLENSGQHTLGITGVSRGPANETSQNLTWVASSGNTSLIPTVNVVYGGTGTTAQLQYTVNQNASGTASITLTLIDNGSNISPNQNTYIQSFNIEVSEVNTQPTLDPIAFGPIQEDAALQTVPLTGISAGAGESQGLTVTVSSTKPELFEILEVVYTSPQTSGTLRIKPAPNAFGSSQITVTVTDSGPNAPAPNVNTISRAFALTIQSVNDLPVFTSTPVTIATVSKLYEYLVEVADTEGETITLTAVTKPTWLSLVSQGNGKARLSGTPPASASGDVTVRLQAKDPSGTAVLQEFTIIVNAPPVVSSFAVSTNEDVAYSFNQAQFAAAFADPDGNMIQELQITKLPDPEKGVLKLNGANLSEGAKIPAAAIGGLAYHPLHDTVGTDVFRWNGSDGLLYSTADTFVDITILPVNDPPAIISLEGDTLQYEVGNEIPQFFTTIFDAVDPDGDSIVNAEIGFRRQVFNPESDRLEFVNTGNISGVYDSQVGILTLTGKASASEYAAVIKTIKYNHINFTDLSLQTRNIYITLSDGKSFSETKDRAVGLIYNYQELDIPTGFTPNGDRANDYWLITSPKGTEQYTHAEIRIFDKRGQLVYETVGFEKPWDGTANGKELPVDTYYYTIDLKFNKIRYKGIVTILR